MVAAHIGFGTRRRRYGLIGYLVRRWRPTDPLDVIEANALHGGNLPLWDGLIIAFKTVTAAGLGASAGLEAGVTQLGEVGLFTDLAGRE